ncbi:MAG: NAD-dependent epimerase/dehydratase family protein, partial [Thiohalorhabdaceae bacterium]
MRVIVLGGDGFCGWPTATHLSLQGHEVTVVDNLARRAISEELDAHSLTPIRPLGTRVQAWEEATGRTIAYQYLDVAADYNQLLALLREIRPDTIVHFAEQRAAPYSMKGSRQKRYTMANNTAATHNLLCALVEADLDAHLVHLGTMGVYGYTTTATPLPDGYLTVQIPGPEGEMEEREILYPASPGSVYHLTKTQDQLAFQFYNANDQLRITDLHQGIVWGTQTEETALDSRLINRFDYDGDFGTVLNRFLMQAAVGHPLTVHGTGGQTRAFIHIRDTVRCVRLAVENPPASGERVRIFNQATETHRVRDLAEKVADLTGAAMEFRQNPRKEAAENELRMTNEGLRRLGWEPVTLDAGLMEE